MSQVIALLLLLLCCATAYGHEPEIDPPWVQNRVDIEQLEEGAKSHASLGFVKSNARKVESVQDSQAYTMAFIKLAIGILGFVVAALTGLLVYVLRRLFNKDEREP